jgi:hypothetical protein
METFYLWTNLRNTRTLTTMFAPFTSGLWITLLVMLIILKATIFFFEHPAAKFRIQWRERQEAMLERGERMAQNKAREGKKDLQEASDYMAEEDSKMHKLMRHADVWGERGKVNTVEGKAITTLIGLLTFVVTACYTANLVSFLNINNDAPMYASRLEFEADGQKACVLTGLKSRVVKSYPTLDIIAIPDWQEIKAAYLRGECTGIVGAPSNLPTMDVGGKFSCRLSQTEALFDIRFGQPISNEYEALYSAYQMEWIEKMKLQALIDRYEIISECGAASGSVQLELDDLVLFLGSVVFIYLCVVVWIIFKRRSADQQADTFGRVAVLNSAVSAFSAGPLGKKIVPNVDPALDVAETAIPGDEGCTD